MIRSGGTSPGATLIPSGQVTLDYALVVLACNDGKRDTTQMLGMNHGASFHGPKSNCPRTMYVCLESGIEMPNTLKNPPSNHCPTGGCPVFPFLEWTMKNLMELQWAQCREGLFFFGLWVGSEIVFDHGEQVWIQLCLISCLRTKEQGTCVCCFNSFCHPTKRVWHRRLIKKHEEHFKVSERDLQHLQALATESSQSAAQISNQCDGGQVHVHHSSELRKLFAIPASLWIYVYSIENHGKTSNA